MCVLVSGCLLVAGGVIFSSMEQSNEDNLSLAIIVGSFVGMVSCMAVIFAFHRYPSMRRYPAPLLYCKTWADLGFSARLFIVEGIVRVHYDSGLFTLEDGKDDSGLCTFVAGVFQFFILASELWFLCIILDIRESIRNPFTNFQKSLIRCGMFCYLLFTQRLFSLSSAFLSLVS